VVVDKGNPRGRLMLVGEGPGANEDIQGLPFVGQGGQLLDRILAAAQLPPEDIYITNAIKCRPPGNRTPVAAEVKTYRPWLERQIELVEPRLLVCLGAVAAKASIDSNIRITRERGQWRKHAGIDIIATYHPAALLRYPSLKREAWQDFQAIGDRYRAIIREEENA
jgi:DNA polymerase